MDVMSPTRESWERRLVDNQGVKYRVDEQGGRVGKATDWKTLNRLNKNFNLLSLTSKLFFSLQNALILNPA